MVDLDKVKTAMKDIANSRLGFAEKSLNKAKKLVMEDPTDGFIINRSYYCMYHSARAAVYIQMQLDVEKHQPLIEKFGKVLRRELKDDSLANKMDKWRSNRNTCDYNPYKTATPNLCTKAISDAELILNTCKNLVEVF